MGYELKPKKGETRMNIILKILGAVLLTLVMLPAFADAQSMNPDSLLELDPNIPQQEIKPEVNPEIKPEVKPEVTAGWRMLNRGLACNTMEAVKSLLTSRGQVLWAGGGKQRNYMPQDPFDNLIITRNPLTKEFTVVLIKPELNLACIIAGGQKLETAENIELKIDL